MRTADFVPVGAPSDFDACIAITIRYPSSQKEELDSGQDAKRRLSGVIEEATSATTRRLLCSFRTTEQKKRIKVTCEGRERAS